MYMASLEELMWAKVQEIKLEARAGRKSSKKRTARKDRNRHQDARRAV